ncbi:hypothetical protein NLJ89_g4353 [Agrocybe chaxingu]|uniref:Cytochrome P450 n=1 Tax=Agrocybe chaxingu TaxID=84603 RepID=A0A9W8K303_9AGAR|nr:hypothetical protein NLJ89_g4353 [Agrocybe chaxingu]
MLGQASQYALYIPTAGLAAVALWLAAQLILKPRKNSLPPGPRRLPFIGNALELRKGKTMEEMIALWWEQYGNIVYVNIFGREIVFINDLGMAQELTEKRGAIYSDRPSLPMFDLLGWKDTLITMPYGTQFRKHRRMMNAVLSEKAVDSFGPVQANSALLLVKLLASDSGKDLEKHISTYTASTIMKIAYGRDVDSLEDPIVKMSLEALTKTLEFGTVSTTILDFIPALKHLPTWAPGAGFKRRALALRGKVELSQSLPYDQVKEQIVSFFKLIISFERRTDGGDCGGLDNLTPQDESDIQGAAAALYTAAEETTLAVVHSFFLAMLLNPDVYKAAQDEMEHVVGVDRLPNPDDMSWTAPTSINAPHRVKEDDVYQGYYIPKGSNVIVNNLYVNLGTVHYLYGLLQACPEPERFLPERFLEGTKLGSVPTNPRDVVFGFGRRRCPGWHFADRSVWVAVAHVTALFDIVPEVDEKGQKIIPPQEFGTSNVRHPKHFPCRVVPREDRKKLLAKVMD